MTDAMLRQKQLANLQTVRQRSSKSINHDKAWGSRKSTSHVKIKNNLNHQEFRDKYGKFTTSPDRLAKTLTVYEQIQQEAERRSFGSNSRGRRSRSKGSNRSPTPTQGLNTTNADSDNHNASMADSTCLTQYLQKPKTTENQNGRRNFLQNISATGSTAAVSQSFIVEKNKITQI